MLKIKNKKLYLFIFILSLVFISISWKTDTKEIKAKRAISFYEVKPDFHWFSIRVRIDKTTGLFVLDGVSGGVRHGKQIDFEKELWRALSRRQLVVGPFLKRETANNAKLLYKSDKKKIRKSSLKNLPPNLHWFLTTFEESPRLGIYVIKRMPGAVFSGNVDNFIFLIYTSLNIKSVPIGPFEDYNQAELAKRLYRMNE